MGVYVKPVSNADEPMLLPFFERAADYGAVRRVGREEFAHHVPGDDGEYGVAVVRNGAFDAAAIALDLRMRWTYATPDGREVAYYICPDIWLLEVDPKLAGFLETVRPTRRH